MTRDQISTIFADNGVDVPSKGVLTQLLNAFNQEKALEIYNAKTKAFDEAEAKYKDYIAPEDHQKIVDELEAEKGKGALAERKAKYEKANLNVEDEDVFNLLESKLKDSKDFDKDLAEYVTAHPSFVKDASKTTSEKVDNANPSSVTLGALEDGKGSSSSNFNQEFRNALGIK